MKQENPIRDKSFDFALYIIKVYQQLVNEKKEYVLSRQLLKCGTSIGANIEEAFGGQSRRDFLSKMSVAYKESRETHYWLRLLRDSDILIKENANYLIDKCEEILKLLGSIQKSTKINS